MLICELWGAEFCKMGWIFGVVVSGRFAQSRSMLFLLGRTMIGCLGCWIIFLGMSGVSEAESKVNISELVSHSLEKAGENRSELEKAIADVPDAQKSGMLFLIAFMPESDAKALKSGFLLQNVEAAYRARAMFPWAKRVPEAVFLNDVLPYASLDEPRDAWRADFLKRFTPYVKGAKSQREVIAIVNQSIRKEVKVEYNTKRKRANQSPAESMAQGMASCTGLSILLVDAFRAVGIPARVAGVPSWTTKPGNHNWVEVWTEDDGKWHFTEYYPDAKGLDHGWLLADAAKANAKSQAHSVYASSWRKTGISFPLVWNWENKDVNAVNVTARYVELGGGSDAEDVCELRVRFLENGKRTAVPVEVCQGDLVLKKGRSPKPTDDMNRYFTVKVKQGQRYQVRWTDPESGKVKVQQITTPKDQGWFALELK
jgi:transglutaminase-like putative cysteine protease